MLDRLVNNLALRKPAYTVALVGVLAALVATLCVRPATAGTKIEFLSKKQVAINSLGCYGLPVLLKIGAMRMSGTYLSYVVTNGRAQSNGLHSGDIILKVNNIPTGTPETLHTVLTSMRNQPVTLDIALGGAKVELKRVPLLQKGSQKNAYANRSVSDLETLMYQLINEDRNKKGLGRLQQSSTLARMARAYADDMAKRGFMGHTDPEGRGPLERAKLLGIRAKSVIAENCYYPYPQKNALDMVREAQNTLMQSPEHSVSILNPDYGCVGVGIAYRRDGGLMVVQEFSAQNFQ